MTPRNIVMVVDDSPGTLGMLTDALEDDGFTVLVAQSGANAIATVERVSPDIILMDALMPEMDGFETCQRIKARSDMNSVPVIFMTGLKDTDSVVKGLQAGGVDYVTKPVVPSEIIARIRVHLANARLARSAQSALDTAGRFLLAVDALGALRWCTPQAAKLLGTDSSGTQNWPATQAAEWIASPSGNIAPLRLDGPAGALEITLIGRVGPDEFLLRLKEAESDDEATRIRRKLHVTARESEVLLWLARGKQNRDIADVLGMSPRTVNKHLEQIYTKLGIENRAAATALATKAIATD